MNTIRKAAALSESAKHCIPVPAHPSALLNDSSVLDMFPEYFSVDHLLEVFPVSRATLYRLAADGTIPCLRIGRRTIFSREHLKQWINQKILGGESP